MSGHSSGQSSSMHVSGFDANRLPEELWLHVLKSLYDGSTREAMVCLLVCKEWNGIIRTLVRELEFGKHLRFAPTEIFPAYNLALPFVRSLKFPNLRSLHLFTADATIGSWRLVFETLGRNCPHLESLRIDEAKPLISIQELPILHASLPRLHTLSVTIEALEGSAIQSLGVLTDVRNLTIGGDPLGPQEYLRVPQNLEHIEALRLEMSLVDFKNVSSEALPSIRSLHLEDISVGLNEVKSLVQLEALSVDYIMKDYVTVVGVLDLQNLSRLRELTHGWCAMEPPGSPSNLQSCRSMTKLHLCQIFAQHLRAIAGLPCLEELCGYLVEDVGGDGLDVVARLPAFRKLRLGCSPDDEDLGDVIRVSARQLEGIAAALNLQELSLDLDEEVGDVTCVGGLTNLWRLELDSGHPTTLTALPALGRPEALSILVIKGWDGLVDLSQLGVLTNLKHLGISECEALLSLSISDANVRLTSLEIKSCNSLVSVISQAPALSSATLSGLAELESVRFQAVSYLSIDGCDTPTVLDPLPPNLEKLVIDRGGSIAHSLPLPKSVQILELVDCLTLTDVHPFQEGALLSTLVIMSCPSIRSIPSVMHLNRLRSITITFCENLSSFPLLNSLYSLCHLKVNYCPYLEWLPDLPPSLVTLHLSHCGNLAGLPAVARPEHARLRIVHLENCAKLEGVHTLVSLGSLEQVVVRMCPRVDCQNATWRSRFQIHQLDPPNDIVAYRRFEEIADV